MEWFSPYQRATLAARVARGLVWMGLACGPAALALGLTAAPQPVERAGEQDAAGVEAAALGPSGWAELAVAAYVAGDLEAVRVYFPTATDAQLPQEPPAVGELRTSVVGAAELAPGYWGVSVAVSAPREDPQSPATRYFTLGVAQGTGGWVAVGLPSEVAAPSVEEPPAVAYAARSLPAGAVSQTVERWARAYLLGEGELDRYLAPGFHQNPITPAPYTDLVPRAVLPAEGHEESTLDDPTEGQTVEVLVQLEARDGGDRVWPLAYALTLRARGQRWEISALRLAPHLETPPASPSPTAESPAAPEHE